MHIPSFISHKIKHKVVLFTTFITLVTLSILASVLYISQKERILSDTSFQMQLHLQDIGNLLDLQIKEKQEQVNTALKVAQDVFTSYGSFQKDSTTVSVTAINQITKEEQSIMLTPWYLGEESVYNNFTIVDRIQELTGQTATIFQKIDAGYLRVSTNVKKLDGSRAVGTYIPNDSEVIQTIEQGKTYRGRAFVVNAWYLTAYEPIQIDGEIVGILYVGVQEKDLNFLKEKFYAKHYFDTGYPYAITQEDELLIHPYAEGENVQDISCIQAMKEQKQGTLTCSWGGDPGQAMVHFFSTYDFFHMTLGIAVPEAELVDAPLATLRYAIFGSMTITVLLLFFLINLFVGKQMAPLTLINEQLHRIAHRSEMTPLSLHRKDEIGTISKSLNQVIDGMQNITAYAQAIGEQRFDVDFEALGEDDTLGNALVSMRDSLRQSAQEAKQRTWINQGQNQITSLIRDHQQSLSGLCTAVLPALVKYVDACQGGIFVYQEESDQKYLTLMAMYAWGRHRHGERKILLQEEESHTLIEQAYLEKEPIKLLEIPEDFVEVTSGLGKANPRNIFILPLLYNGVVYGVLELATFREIDEQTQLFLQEASASIAATIASLATSLATQQLLDETQTKTHEITAMEEELRQNLEEMQATNEEMIRKEKEYIARIAELEAEQAPDVEEGQS